MQATRGGSDMLAQRMAVWFSQRPTFALMGEFSAGKSTLLNVLLGEPLLPARVTATKLPIIWLTHGKSMTWQRFMHDGHVDAKNDETPHWGDWQKYALVRMTFDSPLLELCDVIDTPGISDPRIAAGSLQFIADYLDFAVWCTAANQAWRQSEKAAWSSLPERLRENSILAVTRADQLGKPADIKKVVKRMTVEAGSLFRAIEPISAMSATTSVTAGKINDQQLWVESGAADLLKAIKASIRTAQSACSQREEVIIVEGKNDATPVKTKVAPTISDTIAEIIHHFQAMETGDKSEISKDKFLAKIEHFRGLMLKECLADEAQMNVMVRCFSVGDIGNLNVSRVRKQLEQEIADFAKGAWCQLDETETG